MRIGQLALAGNLLLAPMAGYSDLAFRLLARRHGAALAFTEMVSARGLIASGSKTREFLRSDPEDQPLAVQIFGSEPDFMAEAAQWLQAEGYAAIDINMGCPVRKVVKTGAGAALMRDLSRARQIIAAVRKVASGLLTIKIRSGWDHFYLNFKEMGLMAEGCGVDAVILHPRTARQAFTGSAEWQQIGALKDALKIPVIGNGDVRTGHDARRMQASTGCDGVMIGRGALGNPWIFQDGNPQNESARNAGLPVLMIQLDTILNHLQLIRETLGESNGLNRFRAHMSHYLRGAPGVASLRRYINMEAKTLTEAEEAIRDFFSFIPVESALNSRQGSLLGQVPYEP